jgi:hypothetical protein
MFADLIRFEYSTFHAATDRGKCPTQTLVEVMAVLDAARRGVDDHR